MRRFFIIKQKTREMRQNFHEAFDFLNDWKTRLGNGHKRLGRCNSPVILRASWRKSDISAIPLALSVNIEDTEQNNRCGLQIKHPPAYLANKKSVLVIKWQLWDFESSKNLQFIDPRIYKLSWIQRKIRNKIKTFCATLAQYICSIL